MIFFWWICFLCRPKQNKAQTTSLAKRNSGHFQVHFCR